MATKQEIIDAAIVIKNETTRFANTALRVGTTLENLANKSKGYKSYIALLNQTGTDAPVATGEVSELSDTVNYSYISFGHFNITLAGEFADGKTFVFINNGAKDGLATIDVLQAIVSGARTSDDVITIRVNQPNGGSFGDDALFNATIEIRVYE